MIDWITLSLSLYGASIIIFWVLLRHFAFYKATGYYFFNQPVTLREILFSFIWPVVPVWYYIDEVRKRPARVA